MGLIEELLPLHFAWQLQIQDQCLLLLMEMEKRKKTSRQERLKRAGAPNSLTHEQNPPLQNQRQELDPGTSEKEPQEDPWYLLLCGSSNPQATPGTVVPSHKLLQPKPDLAYT